MSTGQWMTVVSSVLGALGTALLFFFSYTDSPSGLRYWGGPESSKVLEAALHSHGAALCIHALYGASPSEYEAISGSSCPSSLSFELPSYSQPPF
jgi:hypothetical protein